MKPRFRFSISNLLLLTAIVGLIIGWQIDHRATSAKCKVMEGVLHHVLRISYGYDSDLRDELISANDQFRDLPSHYDTEQVQSEYHKILDTAVRALAARMDMIEKTRDKIPVD
jgi:hypothetical protein